MIGDTSRPCAFALCSALLFLIACGLPHSRADDWYWWGDCGTDQWWDECQDDPPEPCGGGEYWWYNNWGQVACGNDPGPSFPGAGASVYLIADSIGLDDDATVFHLSLDVASTLVIGGWYTLTVAGPSVSNDGTISVNQGANTPTALAFENDATLDGSGEVVLHGGGGGPTAQLNTDTGFTLTHATEHTIRAISVGEINAALINEGMVNADAGTLELGTNDKTNNATIMVSNGGELQIEDITITQGPTGQIAADAGAVRLENGAAIVGGTLSTANGGVLCTDYLATATLTDVLNQGQFQVAARSVTSVTGSTLTNDGTITVNPGGAAWPTALTFDGDATLGGSGEVLLDGPATHAQLNTGAGFTLTHAAGHTIRGQGQINAAMVNEGMVNADGGTLQLLTNDKTNNATMMASSGDTLEIEGISVTQGPSGQILADAGNVHLENGAAITGGTLSTANGGVVRTVYAATATLTDVLNQGQFGIVTRATTRVTGSTLTNDGTITVNEGGSYPTILVFDSDVTLDGAGEVVLNWSTSGAQLNTGAGFTLTHTAGHTIRGQGQINAAMVNNGTIQAGDTSGSRLQLNPQDAGITSSGTLIASANCELEINDATLFTQIAGETVVEGTLDVHGAPFDLQGGALSGTGTVTGAVSNAGGEVEPGASAGTLTISGDYTQGSGARLHIELAGPTPGDEYDVLDVTGTATLDGTLRVDPIGGYLPDVGTEFRILTAGSVSGEFGEVIGPGTYDVTYNADNVTLTVVVPPIPGDINRDGRVDLSDLGLLLAAYNACVGDANYNPDADFDESGCIDLSDLGVLLANYGVGT